MKTTLKIDLPSHEKLLSGLAPRDVYPPLTAAEEAVAAAELAVELARKDLADRERAVSVLPERVQRAEVPITALESALHACEARRLMVGVAEAALTRARATLAAEAHAGATARDREIDRRAELLERAVSELAPALQEIADLAGALATAAGPNCRSILSWACSPRCHARES